MRHVRSLATAPSHADTRTVPVLEGVIDAVPVAVIVTDAVDVAV